MHITNSAKSKAVLSLVRNIPGFMTKKGVRTLIVEPGRAIFGHEDGAAAINAIEVSAEEVKKNEETFKSNSLDTLFPNARLHAELEIARETDRTKYKEFKDLIFKLEDLSKEIDATYGQELDFLLDEIKEVADPNAIEQVKNMKVSIISIEDK